MGKVAIIGGGVIGGGWAARFLLNGWDVAVFDPDAEAERKVGEVLANARAALPGLYDRALPGEGALSFVSTVAEAVDGADWVQESVPERLELKHRVYADILAAAGPEAVVASSTSGFKPTELNDGAGRVIVAHPFNPVYLLPLVELVGDAAVCARASGLLTAVGMYPLSVRQEIDAHIADRFLEAVWREALWLVKDGIATTEEIDEAIRMGFGLRWAQMGLFETYRIAGGEAGMKHFIAQFGPALAWPWTKLMNVPELTDELIEMIAAQSDAQSGHLSIRELERVRDGNLVAMMRALKARGHGAGAVIGAHEAGFATDAPKPDAPVETVRRAVPLDWVDYNGHMNEARYLQAFGDATDRFMEMIGCDADYIATGGSYFTAETHIRHLGEVAIGAKIIVMTRVLAGGGKKMHLFHEMVVAGEVVATGEHMMIHVSLETRRASDPAPQVAAALKQFVDGQAALPRPEGAGRAVGVR